MADGFADQTSAEPPSAFGLRAYEAEVEPYHGFILRGTPPLRAACARCAPASASASASASACAEDT